MSNRKRKLSKNYDQHYHSKKQHKNKSNDQDEETFNLSFSVNKDESDLLPENTLGDSFLDSFFNPYNTNENFTESSKQHSKLYQTDNLTNIEDEPYNIAKCDTIIDDAFRTNDMAQNDNEDEDDWEEINNSIHPADEDLIINSNSMELDDSATKIDRAGVFDDSTGEDGFLIAISNEENKQKVGKVYQTAKQSEKVKRITKSDRVLRKEEHKLHLLTLFIAAYIRYKRLFSVKGNGIGSEIANIIPLKFKDALDMGLFGTDLTVAPTKKEKILIAQLRLFLSWWKDHIYVMRNLHSCKNFKFNPKSLLEKWNSYIEWGCHNVNSSITSNSTVHVHEGESSDLDIPEEFKFSPDESVFLFVALCNYLHIPVRLIASFHPVPLTFSKQTKTKGYYRISNNTNSLDASRIQMRKLQRMHSRVNKPTKRSTAINANLDSAESTYGFSRNLEKEEDTIDFQEGYPWRNLKFWCEIYSKWEREWVPIDPIRGIMKERLLFEPKSSISDQFQMPYIVAFEPGYGAKDITQFYTNEWNSRISKLRVSGPQDNMWWDTVLWLFTGNRRVIDAKEEIAMHYKSMNEPMPTSLSKFKNHPLYAIEKLLKTNEAIYPSGKQYSIGTFRSDLVYKRSSVTKLRNSIGWLRTGKKVRSNQSPIKILSPKDKKEKEGLEHDIDLSATTIENKKLYGYWQTEKYQAEIIGPNDPIPRNSFGNFEVFHSNMIPTGTIHIDVYGASAVCKKLNIDHAPVVTGFEFSGGAMVPQIKGVLIHVKDKDLVVEAATAREINLEKKKKEKRNQSLYTHWKRLLLALITKDRLETQYSAVTKSNEEFLEHSNIKDATSNTTILDFGIIGEDVEEANDSNNSEDIDDFFS